MTCPYTNKPAKFMAASSQGTLEVPNLYSLMPPSKLSHSSTGSKSIACHLMVASDYPGWHYPPLWLYLLRETRGVGIARFTSGSHIQASTSTACPSSSTALMPHLLVSLPLTRRSIRSSVRIYYKYTLLVHGWLPRSFQ